MKTTKSEQKNAIALNREIVSGSQDINNVLTTSNVVSPLHHAHYVNMQSGNNGIDSLIAEILTENEAIFPANIDKNVEFRKIAISASMFTCEIVNEVQNRFTAGTKRYPKETIEAYLSVWMTRKESFCKFKVGKIKLTSKEDASRECNRPRFKWYLIDSK
jgi:hypothetical protein